MRLSRLLDKDFWALLISIICSLILFFNSNSKPAIRVQSNIADAVDFITYPKTWYQGIFTIEDHNKTLTDSLWHYKLKYRDLLLEFNDFKNDSTGVSKKMFETGEFFISKSILPDPYKQCPDTMVTIAIKDFKKPMPWTLVPARVTNKGSAYMETIIIDVGLNDSISIKQNLTVIDVFSGALIGKTIAVGNNASKVQLVLDNNFSVSVRVGSGEKTDLGNFVPTAGRYGLLEGILKSTELKEGDLAYTSGISDIYPANIPVAKVVSVNKDNNKPFQDVKVEIIPNFNNLSYVFIVL